MSIRIGHWLEGVFNLNGLKRLLNKLKPEVEAAINAGILAMEAIKKVLDNPGIDYATALTKTGLDDAAVSFLRNLLDKVLLKVRLGKECLGQSDPEAFTKCALQELSGLIGDDWEQAADDIAVQFAIIYGRGKVTFNDVAGILKIVYDKKYKSTLQAAA